MAILKKIALFYRFPIYFVINMEMEQTATVPTFEKAYFINKSKFLITAEKLFFLK